MTKRRSTKRALLLSALSLLMCVSLLVGSTFAWFTDSVTSGKNIIASGNLDVELYYQVEGQSDWTKVTTTSNIFMEDALWEPGHTEVVKLKVVNEGTLALKYQLGVNIASETGSVNVNGDPFKLSEFIKFAVIDGEQDYTREEAVNAAEQNNATLLKTPYGSDSITLLPQTATNTDNADIVTMVVYMPTSVDNRANYAKGKAVPTIELGINLYATQVESESDSFGNDYDAALESGENGVERIMPDGSTIFYYNEDSGFGGRVRLTDLPENLGNEYTVPAEVNDLGGTLVGVTLDKLTIPAGVEYANKSLQGATIDEVVIEEGTTTIPNRLFYKANVENVVIPDSVTTIDESAFQQVNLDTIVIPASVTYVDATAFAASQVKTVIFEGSPEIQNKAFRGCTQLEKVYFNGDDVTFTNTTGQANCWFCNKESNNPNYSNITFYVKNETVAAKVRAAMGAELPATTPIYVNGFLFLQAKNATEMQTALNATQDTIVSLTADITGDVAFTQNNDVSVVLNGNGKKMDGGIKITARASIGNAATLDIKNINFVTTDSTRAYFIDSVENNRYPNNLTISNCTFEGTGADSSNVAVSIKTANNFVMEYCTANNVHSLLQNSNGGWSYTIRHCVVTNAGRGMSFGSAQNIYIEDVKIQASNEKYGIRMAAEYNTTATIKDCQISAFCPVVVRRASANYALVFEGENTMTAANTDGLWCAIGTGEYETNGSMPSAATGRVTVTLNDTGLNTTGIYGTAN